MTLTPERIAEIDKTGSLFVDNGEREDGAALEELCRLARLGMKVDAAPVGLLWPDRDGHPDAAIPVLGEYRYCAVSDSEIPRMSRVRLVIE